MSIIETENKLQSILKPTLAVTEPSKTSLKPKVESKVESILNINGETQWIFKKISLNIFIVNLELNTPSKPLNDEPEKKVILKTTDNIKNLKPPQNKTNNTTSTGKNLNLIIKLSNII
jgi:hypothetical protein